jgi:hypothetical protein
VVRVLRYARRETRGAQFSCVRCDMASDLRQMPTVYSPMRLLRIPEPFDHRDFVFDRRSMDFERWHTCAGITASSCRATDG